MSRRLIRLGQFTALCVMLAGLAPQSRPVVEARQGVSCTVYISDFVLSAPPEQYLGGYGTSDSQQLADSAACISLFNSMSTAACATACSNAGVSSGNYGVAYCNTYGNEARWYPGAGFYHDNGSYPKDCGGF